MTWVDYIFIGIVSISAIAGLARGFMREVISLFTWLLALWIAWQYFRLLANHIQPWIESPAIRSSIAFFILFFVTLILGGTIGMALGRLIDQSMYSFMDQFFGVIFGFARGALIVLIMALLGGLTTLPREPWWQESRLLIPMQQIATKLVIDWLPPDISR
ncbi:hypothetical protein TI03_05155, partial [Achromatium sp. WMS1]